MLVERGCYGFVMHFSRNEGAGGNEGAGAVYGRCVAICWAVLNHAINQNMDLDIMIP